MIWFVYAAVIGAVLVAVGIGWLLLPAAGMIVGGIEMIGAATLGAYFKAEATKRDLKR